MLIEFSGHDTIKVKAPAKINLFLEILGKRSDGFHEIETVMCPVQLFDTITVKKIPLEEVRLEVQTPEQAGTRQQDAAWSVPANENNLVFRSALAVQQNADVKHGYEIKLHKVIPAAAGLGGGSSDAAAAIVACLVLAGKWDRGLATDLCSKLGSDIPFFLGSANGIGLMLSQGRGEICTPLDAKPTFDLLLSHPGSGCSTAQIYQQFQTLQTVRNSEKIISACEAGQVPKIGAELFNALQFAASDLNPWIEKQLKLFSNMGLSMSLMSGSGSACFALAWPDAIELDEFREHAIQRGIPRAYQAKPWYAPSIEQQIKSVPQNNN